MQCLSKKNKDMNLRGTFFAKEFEYIEIKLVMCPAYGGDECASPQEISDYFDKRRRLNFQCSFANNLVNIEGHESSLEKATIIDERLYFDIDVKSS